MENIIKIQKEIDNRLNRIEKGFKEDFLNSYKKQLKGAFLELQDLKLWIIENFNNSQKNDYSSYNCPYCGSNNID